MTSNKDLKREVEANIQSLKDKEAIHDMQNLGVKVESNLSHQVRGMEVKLTCGGPLVKLDLFNNVIHGYWGKDEYHRVIRDEDALQCVEAMKEHYVSIYEMNGGDK